MLADGVDDVTFHFKPAGEFEDSQDEFLSSPAGHVPEGADMRGSVGCYDCLFNCSGCAHVESNFSTLVRERRGDELLDSRIGLPTKGVVLPDFVVVLSRLAISPPRQLAFQKVDHETIELLRLLVLGPVAGMLDDVEFGAGHLLVGHLGHLPGSRRVVVGPEEEEWRLDLAQSLGCQAHAHTAPAPAAAGWTIRTG